MCLVTFFLETVTNLQWVDRKLVGNRCDTRYITEQAFVDCFNDVLLYIYQVATNLLAASLYKP